MAFGDFASVCQAQTCLTASASRSKKVGRGSTVTATAKCPAGYSAVSHTCEKNTGNFSLKLVELGKDSGSGAVTSVKCRIRQIATPFGRTGRITVKVRCQKRCSGAECVPAAKEVNLPTANICLTQQSLEGGACPTGHVLSHMDCAASADDTRSITNATLHASEGFGISTRKSNAHMSAPGKCGYKAATNCLSDVQTVLGFTKVTTTNQCMPVQCLL